MSGNILIGSILIVATSFVHLGLTQLGIFMFRKNLELTSLKKVLYIEGVVLASILAALLEATIWAAYYFASSAFITFEESLYFSLVTYATLGYGDVVLDGPRRLLGAFEAANGAIMFGWSTALVVAALQKLYASNSKT